jgi:hypothetical protein
MVVVVSEARGRDWLAEQQSTVEPGRLLLLDYVLFEQLPGVLASADLSCSASSSRWPVVTDRFEAVLSAARSA